MFGVGEDGAVARGHGSRCALGHSPAASYRGYSKLRTHTALGPYGTSMPRSIGPS